MSDSNASSNILAPDELKITDIVIRADLRVLGINLSSHLIDEKISNANFIEIGVE